MKAILWTPEPQHSQSRRIYASAPARQFRETLSIHLVLMGLSEVICGLLPHFWLLLFKLSLFSCRWKRRENHLTFLRLFKKKGKGKEKYFFSPERNGFVLIFFFFLITCLGRPRPPGLERELPISLTQPVAFRQGEEAQLVLGRWEQISSFVPCKRLC